jgi:hypothetical protein
MSKYTERLQKIRVEIDLDLPVAATYAEVEEWLAFETGQNSMLISNPLSNWELRDLAKRVDFRERWEPKRPTLSQPSIPDAGPHADPVQDETLSNRQTEER